LGLAPNPKKGATTIRSEAIALCRARRALGRVRWARRSLDRVAAAALACADEEAEVGLDRGSEHAEHVQPTVSQRREQRHDDDGDQNSLPTLSAFPGLSQ